MSARKQEMQKALNELIEDFKLTEVLVAEVSTETLVEIYDIEIHRRETVGPFDLIYGFILGYARAKEKVNERPY